MAARRTAVLGLAIATLVVVVLAAGGGSVKPAEEGCCGWTWDLWGDDAVELPVQELDADDGRPVVVDEPLEGDDVLTLFVRIASVLAVAVLIYLLGRFLWRTARAVKVEPLADPDEWTWRRRPPVRS